jgi:circadian clock protein KaiC
MGRQGSLGGAPLRTVRRMTGPGTEGGGGVDTKRTDLDGEEVATLPLADPTGVPNLDMVMGGGIPRGALVIIVGPPGSGKTTLANHMAFEAARRGRRTMVLTALSEPTSKLIAHLSSFRFFDEDLVGETIEFLSLQQFLSGGLETTGDQLVAEAKRRRAGFVVLDGFRGVRGASGDPQQARQFLYDVGTTLSVLGATTIITSEADPRDPVFFPEATTGDVILGLRFDLSGVRQWRGIEVIKMRGSAPLDGLHGLALTDEGVVIYPRLETRVAATTAGSRAGELVYGDIPEEALRQATESDGRATFGIPELDALLGGGLTRGTSTLVVGSIGTGKTLLSLHFALAGALAGESTLFLSFRESLLQLLLKTQPFGLGDQLRRALSPGGNLALLRWAPVELNADIVAEQVMTQIETMRAKRLVVDSAAELERSVAEADDPHRVDNYLAALVEAMRQRDVTALFTKEIPQTSAPELDFSRNPISVMAENVLLLRQIERHERLIRLLSVIKMRFSRHDASTVREFAIDAPEGIHFVGSPASPAGTLTERGVAPAEGSPVEGGEAGRTSRRTSRGARQNGDGGAGDDQPEGRP